MARPLCSQPTALPAFHSPFIFQVVEAAFVYSTYLVVAVVTCDPFIPDQQLGVSVSVPALSHAPLGLCVAEA